jgi:hypothetical protein
MKDLNPTCNGSAAFRKVLQPYFPEDYDDMGVPLEDHGWSTYAITLSSEISTRRLRWDGHDVMLTLTAVPGSWTPKT